MKAISMTQGPSVVELRFEGLPEEVFVRGHYGPADHAAVLEAAGDYLDEIGECVEGYQRPALRVGAQRWARWGLGWSEDHELGRYLYTSKTRTRGSFPVTVVWSV